MLNLEAIQVHLQHAERFPMAASQAVLHDAKQMVAELERLYRLLEDHERVRLAPLP